MPLSRRDLEQIRAIVREEIERAGVGDHDHRGRHGQDQPGSASKEELHRRSALKSIFPDLDLSDLNEADRREVHRRVKIERAHQAELDRKRQERAARPISGEPFVDVYDARRLLNKATGVSADQWIKRGVLKRQRINGLVRISRAEIDALVKEHRRPK